MVKWEQHFKIISEPHRLIVQNLELHVLFMRPLQITGYRLDHQMLLIVT
jgi:hypothetical protein